jgi:hypothetical protein
MLMVIGRKGGIVPFNMANNPGDSDPLGQFQSGELHAPLDDVRFMLGLARGLLNVADYEIQHEFGFHDPETNGFLIFTAVEAHDKDGVQNLTRVGIGGEGFWSVDPLHLVYAEDNDLVYISPPGARDRARSAKCAAPILKSLVNLRFGNASEGEEIVIGGLQSVVHDLSNRKSVENGRVHPSTPIFSTIKNLSLSMGATPTREAATEATLSDFSTVKILGRDYIFTDVPEDYNPSKLVRVQIDLEDAFSGKITSFLEYHDGSTYCDSLNEHGDEEEDRAVHEEVRACGLYTPTQQDVERLTNALIEFSFRKFISEAEAS